MGQTWFYSLGLWWNCLAWCWTLWTLCCTFYISAYAVLSDPKQCILQIHTTMHTAQKMEVSQGQKKKKSWSFEGLDLLMDMWVCYFGTILWLCLTFMCLVQILTCLCKVFRLDVNGTSFYSFCQSSWTKHQLYGHLPSITKTIQVTRTGEAGTSS